MNEPLKPYPFETILLEPSNWLLAFILGVIESSQPAPLVAGEYTRAYAQGREFARTIANRG